MSEVWRKIDLPLKKRHGWKATPGYNICAINRGAIRFDYPEGWKIDADSDSLNIRDLPEPNDNCVLKVSQMHLPEVADEIPLREFVKLSMDKDPREILERHDIVEAAREDGIELCSGELRYVDPTQKREALSRLCIARSGGVYCLITFDFWMEDAARLEQVWTQALRSLILGVYIEDPSVGPVVQ